MKKPHQEPEDMDSEPSPGWVILCAQMVPTDVLGLWVITLIPEGQSPQMLLKTFRTSTSLWVPKICFPVKTERSIQQLPGWTPFGLRCSSWAIYIFWYTSFLFSCGMQTFILKSDVSITPWANTSFFCIEPGEACHLGGRKGTICKSKKASYELWVTTCPARSWLPASPG